MHNPAHNPAMWGYHMLVLQSLVFGLFVAFVVFIASFRWNRRRLHQLASKIPGPRGLPFIGSGYKFINAGPKEIFNAVMNVTKGYDSIMKIWVGPELVVFAHTPESLQIVLNSPKCLDKSPLYEVFGLNNGLLVNGGQMWRNHRKILNPSFSINVLQKLIPNFDQKSKRLVKNMKAEVGKAQFNVYGYISACSLETLLKGTMDIERDIQSKPFDCLYINQVEIASPLYMSKMLNVLYRFEPFYRISKLYQLEKKYVLDGVFKIADEVLNEKRASNEVVSQEHDSDPESNFYTKRQKNFIETLIEPNNNLSEQEIKDEINTFLAAGHETSALVISNALLMLALHPEVQRKAVQELKEVFGTIETPIDNNTLNKLTYLDMIVKETMRLYPVLPVSARMSSEEFEIGDYTVPVGATLVISAFNVQRNKKYWGEDADDFRPERFEPESFVKIHPYAYIPFTGGPRICIGWRYGMLFMKTVLSNVLRNYELSSKLNYKELDYELVVSMKIAQRCMISVVTRNFSD